MSIEQFVQDIIFLVIIVNYNYKRIRNLREDKDLTQKDVGQAINIPQRTYAYYESGERTIPPHVLVALAIFIKQALIILWS